MKCRSPVAGASTPSAPVPRRERSALRPTTRLTRREALAATLALAACGPTTTVPVVEAGMPPTGEGWLEVKLAEHPSLAAPGGATVIEAPLVNVWVLHRADGSFVSVWRVCTHGACDVRPVPGELFECPCHGSRFGPDGAVLTGPATRPLARFEVVRAGESLYLRRG